MNTIRKDKQHTICIFANNTPRSALKGIADDLCYYLSKYNFNVNISSSFDLTEILSYDIIITIPDIYELFVEATPEQILNLNKKCIPIYHHYPLTPFHCFLHRFIHGFWETPLGYINHEIGKEIDKLIKKYEKIYLPIGVNSNKFYQTRKISKIKKIGFVGRLSNLNNPNADCWCSNKRPDMFIDIANKSGLDYVSLSDRDNNYKLYDDIDLVICTSIQEGNPMGLLESTACKIPFISTPCGIVNEYNNIKTFNTVDEAVAIINELNSSKEILEKYIFDVYHELFPGRDWHTIIPKYWLPFIIKKINSQYN